MLLFLLMAIKNCLYALHYKFLYGEQIGLIPFLTKVHINIFCCKQIVIQILNECIIHKTKDKWSHECKKNSLQIQSAS